MSVRPTTLLQIGYNECLPVNIAKFLRTKFFIEQVRWLLFSYIHADQLNTIIEIIITMKMSARPVKMFESCANYM